MYRGVSFGDAFQRVKDELNKPIMYTEFGADAFNTIENAEDQQSQAYYMVNNWKEIYENAAGLGKVGNSIGGSPSSLAMAGGNLAKPKIWKCMTTMLHGVTGDIKVTLLKEKIT